MKYHLINLVKNVINENIVIYVSLVKSINGNAPYVLGSILDLKIIKIFYFIFIKFCVIFIYFKRSHNKSCCRPQNMRG